MPPVILSKNPVELLADKLRTENIPERIRSKAAETFRVLETRVPTGSLGKIDRQSTRAAVILEQAYRAETKGRLPWQKLANVVNCKSIALQHLQQSVNNYLHDAIPAEAVTAHTSSSEQARTESSIRMEKVLLKQAKVLQERSCSSRKRPLTEIRDALKQEMDQNSRRSSRLRPTEPDSKRLEELSLRVNVMDPHKGCLQARELLRHMMEYASKNSSTHDRRYRLHDYQRYTAAYEAAALYCVIEGSIKLETLAEASTHFTFLELKQVLPHTKEMAEKLLKYGAEDVVSVKEKGPSSEEQATGSLFSTSAWAHTDALDHQKLEQEREKRAQEHLAWEEQVIQSSIDKARSSLKDSNGGSFSELSADQLLSHAVSDIFEKYNIVTN